MLNDFKGFKCWTTAVIFTRILKFTIKNPRAVAFIFPLLSLPSTTNKSGVHFIKNRKGWRMARPWFDLVMLVWCHSITPPSIELLVKQLYPTFSFEWINSSPVPSYKSVWREITKVPHLKKRINTHLTPWSSIVLGGTRSFFTFNGFNILISYFGIYSLLKMRDFLGKITKCDILGKNRLFCHVAPSDWF